ncbi:MAG: hypothetical protein JW791_00915 [Nanoarchaeota archaeon]|nr:hypothetical protein [Nanoarchaeota archaeon]
MRLKAQVGFENFLIGFLFVFILASSVFLFIGGSVEGAGIDLFNRTIFSEPVSGLDYLYLDTYTNGDVNNFNNTAYTFTEATDDSGNVVELNLSFTVTRTFLPPSSEPFFPIIFYVKWFNCPTIYVDDCREVTNNLEQSIVFNSLKLQSYYFNYTLPGVLYTDCTTDITIGAIIESSDLFNETVLDNNFYTFTIPYCFYEPTDASITAACVPRDNNIATTCTSQRYWDNTQVYGGELC